jgi:hypothetical protein
MQKNLRMGVILPSLGKEGKFKPLFPPYSRVLDG